VPTCAFYERQGTAGNTPCYITSVDDTLLAFGPL